GARAGRLLISLLVQACSDRQLILSPPRCITPGEAAEAAMGVGDLKGQAPAGPLLRKLAWVESLRRSSSQELAGLLPEHTPAASSSYWSAIGNALMKCHEELAGEGIEFGDVAQRSQGLAMFEEEDRWKAASAVQTRYERTLDSWGTFDPALRRLRRSPEPSPDASAEIVLLGVADLNRSTRDALLACRARIRAVVFAPPEEHAAFDDLGCVIPEAWENRALPIDDSRIEFADSPADQADLTLGLIGRFGDRFAAHEIVIGVPDSSVVPVLERIAAQCNASGQSIAVRAAAGIPFSRSAPGAALRLLNDHAQDNSWASLAALIRNADIERWLDRTLPPELSRDWIVAMEDLRRRSLAPSIPDAGLPEPLASVVAAIADLVAPLRHAENPSVRHWPAILLELLRRLYGGISIEQPDPAARRTVEACRLVKSRLAPLAQRPALDALSLEGTDFLALALEAIDQEPLPPRADDHAVELLGWLELAMDPARAVIVTGMNEGSVPGSTGADPFLPNALRQHLGLPSDRTRLARDLYLATALCHSREELHFISGRRDTDGTPLSPSRILLAAPPATIVSRLAAYAGKLPLSRPRPAVERSLRAGPRCAFTTCPRAPGRPITSMTVTSFRSYLASPYRFFLEHILGLCEQDAPGPELDPGDFGTIIHEALRDFGRGSARHSTDPDEIRDAVITAFDAHAADRFGANPPAPVWLQLRSARLRLESFAPHQARWRSQGWKIHSTEWRPDPEHPASITVDGIDFGLRGSIDRIDKNEQGDVAILDYKTSDSATRPEKSHRTRDRWIDLQLPLYRHLAKGLQLFTLESNVSLGYVTLARDPADICFLKANWTPEDLQSADDAAADVIRAVRSQDFWNLGKVLPSGGALDALCGVGILGAAPAAEEEDDAP
ncbi:MAG: PD-(D/E)XK nuclease family protein, partial [Phycisphaerales bacterium]